jgi:hypothetical protein
MSRRQWKDPKCAWHRKGTSFWRRSMVLPREEFFSGHRTSSCIPFEVTWGKSYRPWMLGRSFRKPRPKVMTWPLARRMLGFYDNSCTRNHRSWLTIQSWLILRRQFWLQYQGTRWRIFFGFCFWVLPYTIQDWQFIWGKFWLQSNLWVVHNVSTSVLRAQQSDWDTTGYRRQKAQ